MASQELPWYVLHTKSRHEKKVAERLQQAGYKVYCPLHKVKRQWSDRIKIVEEPLFKGYIFICIPEDRRDEVFAFPGTVRYLFWLREPAKVRANEIEAIQKWLGDFEHHSIALEAIVPGSLVRITSGKFMNEEAVLLDQGRNKAVVQLKELGVQLTLDLSSNDIHLM